MVENTNRSDSAVLQFLKKLGWDGLSAINRHKFKSVILAILLYGTYKTYGLYKSFKDLTSGMSDMLDNRQPSAEKSNLSPSEKALLNYITT